MPPQDKNLIKLENLIKLLDEQVTKEDFTKAFEQVLNLVVQIEKRTADAISSLEKTYANLMDKMQNNHSSAYSDLKGQVDHVFVNDRINEMKKEHDAKMTEMDKKIANVKDGKAPTSSEIISLIRPLIPVPIKGDDGKAFPVEKAKIILNQMFDEMKKDFAQKFQQSAERTMSVARRGGLLGLGGQSVIVPRPLSNIIPTGSINGINKDFILPKAPTKNGERVYLNGVRMRSGSSNDYTIAGKILTFNTAPLTGDIILVDIDF